MEEKISRCPWGKLEGSALYQKYHDEEWGVASYEDGYLFEMMVLEAFQCGLSWLTILEKRENFRNAFDGFDYEKISKYGEDKISALMEDGGIVRNRRKIEGAVKNARAFKEVQKEFGSFSAYIWGFTGGEVEFYGEDESLTKNATSDRVSKDLKKRGFSFMGSVVVFSYLEAIGVMNHHVRGCHLCGKK